MTNVDPSMFAVLHALRIRGFADETALAETTLVSPSTISGALARLREDDLALHRDGRITGWRLTPSGRERHAQLLSSTMDEPGLRDAVEDAHRQFTPLNARFKETCTNWQLRNVDAPQGEQERVAAQLLSDMRGVHAKVTSLVEPVAVRLPSFEGYRHRFDRALARLERGEHDALARPLTGSYHDVWMELHQDLILRLGLERTDADA